MSTTILTDEPVAFLVDWPDEPDLGHYFADEQATIGRSQPLITTAQAEAYADARVAESQQWQPIETAPRDGRTLLLGYFNSHDKWRTVRGQWISKKEIADNWEYDDAEPGWYETSVEAEDIPNCWPTAPTHWMPLPAPPLPGPAIEPKENHGN